MRWWVLISVACGAAPTHPPGNAVIGHDPELAIVDEQHVRLYLVTPKGLQLEREVTLPSTVGSIAWVGDKPVAMMQAQPWDDAHGDASKDGQIGWIGKTFEPFPAVTAWVPNAPKPDDAGMYASAADHPAWRMVVTRAGEVWQGRSEWYFVPDAGGPSNWVFARLAPPPATSTTDEPTWLSGYPLPKLAPPASPQADVVSTGPKTEDEGGPIRPENLLHCTIGGTTVELPPEGDPRTDLFNVDNLEWLATDPPVFRVDEIRAGYTAIVSTVMYEGCTPSATVDSVAVGPDGVIAIYGRSELRLVRGGRVIDKAPGGSVVVFKHPS